MHKLVFRFNTSCSEMFLFCLYIHVYSVCYRMVIIIICVGVAYRHLLCCRLYVIVNEPDLAISMYKKIN